MYIWRSRRSIVILAVLTSALQTVGIDPNAAYGDCLSIVCPPRGRQTTSRVLWSANRCLYLHNKQENTIYICYI